MANTSVDVPERKTTDRAVLLLNVGLVVLVALFILFSVRHFDQRTRQVSLKESRFLLTEWHLLQTLKAQTETQLQEKDQQISSLTKRIDELSKQQGAEEELQVLRNLLKSVEEERAAIASRRAAVTVDGAPATAGGTAPPLPEADTASGEGASSAATVQPPSGVRDVLEARISELKTAISGLERRTGQDAAAISDYQATIADFVQTLAEYQAQFLEYEQTIESLQGRISGYEARIRAAEDSAAAYQNQIELMEKELAALKEQSAQYEADAQERRATIEERDATIEDLRASLEESAQSVSDLRTSVDQLTTDLRNLEAGYASYQEAVNTAASEMTRLAEQSSSNQTPSAESIRTWALLKALLSTPSIRSQYPDLLGSMEAYIQSYGEREYRRGLNEAYQDAVDALRRADGEN